MRLYILLMPFSSVFALHQALPLYLIYLVFIYTKKILSKGFDSKFKVDFPDFFLASFLAVAFFSYFTNEILYFDSNFNGIGHLVAYFVSSLFFYFLLKSILFNYFNKVGLNGAFFWIYFTTFFVVIFIIVEFLFKNILLLPFDIFIPRPAVTEMNAMALGSFLRARGLAEEPGHMMMYLEIMIPISVYYLISNKKYIQNFLFLSLSFISIVVTFSAAAFVIIPVSIFFSMIYFFITNRVRVKIIFLFYFIFIVFILLSFYFILNYFGWFDIAYVTDQVLTKVNAGNSSFDDRANRIASFNNVFQSSSLYHVLLGFGPGAYKELGIDSVVSLYPTLLLEVGFFGLLFFLLFVFSVFYEIFKIKSIVKYFLFSSFLSAVLHFLIVSNYWYPWFWFAVTLAVVLRKYYNNDNTFSGLD